MEGSGTHVVGSAAPATQHLGLWEVPGSLASSGPSGWQRLLFPQLYPGAALPRLLRGHRPTQLRKGRPVAELGPCPQRGKQGQPEGSMGVAHPSDA